MKTLFEIAVMWDAESSTCKDYYDVDVDVNNHNLYNEVKERYMNEHEDDNVLDCNVIRLVPESEANVIRDECGMTDTYMNECTWF